MNRSIFYKVLTPIFAATLLVACGGGDTSSSSEPAKPTKTAEKPAAVAETKNETPAKEAVEEVSAEDKLLKRGKIVWFKCRSCHETDVGRPHKVGPNLNGLMGATAGTKEGFVFSDAMKDSAIVWDAETLDAFIAKPASYIKGTKMAFVGISKESDRLALIKYLEENTKSEE